MEADERTVSRLLARRLDLGALALTDALCADAVGDISGLGRGGWGHHGGSAGGGAGTTGYGTGAKSRAGGSNRRLNLWIGDRGRVGNPTAPSGDAAVLDDGSDSVQLNIRTISRTQKYKENYTTLSPARAEHDGISARRLVASSGERAHVGDAAVFRIFILMP